MSPAGLSRSLALIALVVSAAACGSSSSTPMTPTPTPTPTTPVANVVITINGMNGASSYSPSPAAVTLGQTVAWKNADAIAHTATQDNGGFDTSAIAPGATSAPITLAAGSFSYHCSFHPSMVGSLTVK